MKSKFIKRSYTHCNTPWGECFIKSCLLNRSEKHWTQKTSRSQTLEYPLKTHCNTLQHTATHCITPKSDLIKRSEKQRKTHHLSDNTKTIHTSSRQAHTHTHTHTDSRKQMRVEQVIANRALFPLRWGRERGAAMHILKGPMGWLRLVGALKVYDSLAEYRLFYRALLQKRPVVWRSLLVGATPYQDVHRRATLATSHLSSQRFCRLSITASLQSVAHIFLKYWNGKDRTNRSWGWSWEKS